MNTQADAARRILAVAGGLGVLGDILFHNADGLGVNGVVWICALIAAARYLALRAQVPVTAQTRWLGVLLLIGGVLPAIRDSGTLLGYDILACLLAGALAAAYFRNGDVARSGMLEYLRAAGYTAIHAIVFPPLLARLLDGSGFRNSGWSRTAGAAARGVLIAVPILCVFAGLFAAADPVFAHYVNTIFRWNPEEFCIHLATILGIFWLAAGYFRVALLETEPLAPLAEPSGNLGKVEIGIVLGLMDALFAAFVFVQIHYLFGGAARVAALHLTYAEYARKGFFELVWAIGLCLPVLLLLHQFTDRTNAGADRAYHFLALILVLLLAVVMASAVQRMRLYVDAYGLTELRLYTSAAMGWFALVFVWFALTVLRGRRERFAVGALATGMAALVIVCALDPDALIVRTNIALAQRTGRFDACYATDLSADAVKPLTDSLPKLPSDKQPVVAYRLLRFWSPAPADLRTWNLGRISAWNSVQRHIVVLRQDAAGIQSDPCVRSEE